MNERDAIKIIIQIIIIIKIIIQIIIIIKK